MNQQILSQDEVDALLQGITGESPPSEPAPAAPGSVREIDLASQERLVRSRMPALEIVNERFARNIRGALAKLILKTPEVAIA